MTGATNDDTQAADVARDPTATSGRSQGPGTTPGPSDASSHLVLFLLVPIVVALVIVILDRWRPGAIPKPNDGFATGVEAIAFISAAALAIERTLEGFWTALGSKLGGWWPLRSVTRSIEAYEQQTNLLLTGPLTNAIRTLESAKTHANATAEDIKMLDAHLAAVRGAPVQLQEKMNAAQKLAPGSPRFQIVAEVAGDGLDVVRGALDRAAKVTGEVSETIVEAAEDVASACDRIGAFITSFDDNPARKIASLCLGAALGLVVTALLGLNMFVALLEGDVAGQLAGLTGILLTGVVVGLGANPTHEVIKALQRRKAASGAPSTTAPAQGTTTVVNIDASGSTRLPDMPLVSGYRGADDVRIDLDPVSPLAVFRSTPPALISSRRERIARRTD